MDSELKNVPELGAEAAHVWRLFVPDFSERYDSLYGVLSAQEQAKAARFRFEADRTRSVAARGALRLLLSAYLNVSEGRLEFGESENGKPFLAVPDVRIGFNVSHSGDWVLLAFTRDGEVGVDVEEVRKKLDIESIASRFFAEEETALIQEADDAQDMFFRLWSRKEAYVKALGSGLFRELNSFSVPVENGSLPSTGFFDEWAFHELDVAPAYAAAAVVPRRVGRVDCFDFSERIWRS